MGAHVRQDADRTVITNCDDRLAHQRDAEPTSMFAELVDPAHGEPRGPQHTLDLDCVHGRVDVVARPE